jgi:hypothetical protein
MIDLIKNEELNLQLFTPFRTDYISTPNDLEVKKMKKLFFAFEKNAVIKSTFKETSFALLPLILIKTTDTVEDDSCRTSVGSSMKSLITEFQICSLQIDTLFESQTS